MFYKGVVLGKHAIGATDFEHNFWLQPYCFSGFLITDLLLLFFVLILFIYFFHRIGGGGGGWGGEGGGGGVVGIPTAAKVPLCLTLPPHPVRSTDMVSHPKGFAPFSFILREIHSGLSKRNRHVLNCVLISKYY